MIPLESIATYYALTRIVLILVTWVVWKGETDRDELFVPVVASVAWLCPVVGEFALVLVGFAAIPYFRFWIRRFLH